jgi:opacity protein-like surface antigen
MVRARLTISTLAMAALLVAGTAQAADYSQPPQPPPIYVQPPPVIEEFSSWYLRGDVGIGINNTYKVDYLPAPGNAGNGFAFDKNSNADTFFLGGGVGYEWNNWLRFDVTAEYRARTQVNARGVFPGGAFDGDTYQGYLKSWVFLANAYADLGTWNCFTPFVGVGVGVTRNTLADFTDAAINGTGHGFGRNTSEWHPAWALHAGVAYNVSKNFKIELAYRYLNLGSITDTIDCVPAGGCAAGPDSYKFSNIYSQDIKIGLRWTCCDVAPSPPQYVYTPPPVYAPPPPLRSKG